MKKVFITGAGGFIGRALVAGLKKGSGIRIKTFSLKDSSLSKPSIFETLIGGADVVYHLAAVNDSKGPGIFKTNVFGSWAVLEAVRRYSPSAKFVFTSSFAVYKVPKQKTLIDENCLTIPLTLYGLTKLIAEKICLVYSKLFGIKIAIARISNAYGPGMPPFKHSVVATFIEKIKKGQEVEIQGDGTQTRDFIYVDDVVGALIALGEKSSAEGVFNICSGNSVSLNKLVDLIERKFKRKVARMYKGGVERASWVGDNRKTKKVLSWSPRTSFVI